jgi:O-antigen biosynthesis protein
MTLLASSTLPPWRANARMALSRLTDSLLVEPHRQNELLASLSAAALQDEEFEAAFMFADRRCRRPTPSARDFLLRASVSRRLGYDESAMQDLARAVEIDPTDELVLSNALRWGPQALRRIAAGNFIGGISEDRDTLALALRAFKSARVPIASRLQIRGGMYRGWIAWAEACVLELRIRRGTVESSFVLEADPAHPLAADGWSAAEIAIEMQTGQLMCVSFHLDGELVMSSSPSAILQGLCDRTIGAQSVASSREPPNQVDIIVPVYENYIATKACLDSLEHEGSKITKRVIVIDDCTPNEDLRALLDERASRGLFTLLRNDENLGFARSVNLALARRQHGDVLFLNADTLLPRGAIDRLAAAAYLQADVGTVTPLSNNGEFTSFPQPNVANALGAMDEIQSIDDAAQIVNRHDIIDLPTGIGFCLYVSRACADVVGPLCELYSRGYYEDVEFCLRAQEAGFRNVCATGVFVGHAGANSFLDEKRALVVRNQAILEARFPEHRLQCGAFLKADPLAPTRAKIEERMLPEGVVVLLVAPAVSAHALVLERARQIQSADDRHCLLCEFSELDSSVIVRSLRGAVPQSLSFVTAGRSGKAKLESYLRRLQLEAVEVFDPQSLLEDVLKMLFDLGAPPRVAFGDLQWVCGNKLALDKACSDAQFRGGCDRCVSSARSAQTARSAVETTKGSRMREVLRRAGVIVPLDRMAAAFSTSYLKSLVVSPSALPQLRGSTASLAKLEPAILGVICPEATGEADRQIVALARMFRLRGIDALIVVLGRCADELGVMATLNIFVTAAIAREEYPQVIRQYGIGRLFSPYRTRHFGIVDDLGAVCGLQKAYFDWSFGALAIDDGDLALDPRICVERAALEVGAWLFDPADCFRP